MIRENLKTIRESRGYSKSELARKSGVNKRTIEYIEYGKTLHPRLDILLKLSTTLEVNVIDLIQTKEG